MYSGRSKRILEIITRGQEESEGSIMIAFSQTRPYVDRMAQALRNRFTFLASHFPRKSLAKVLSREETRNVQRGVDEDVLAVLRRQWREILDAWLEQPDPNSADIGTALAAAALAGFTAAFLAWCQQNGMSSEMAQRVWTAAQEWAEGQATELVEDIQSVVQDGVEKLIEQGLHGGQSTEQIVDAVLQYLAGDAFATEMVETLADYDIATAFQEGAFYLNVLAGCTQKQWFVKDSEACGRCVANANLGVQEITFHYEGHVLTPPAHNRCRCSMLYFGVTPAMLDRLTEDARADSRVPRPDKQ